MRRLLFAVALAGALVAGASVTTTGFAESPAAPNFGPNVHILNPALSQSTVQAELDSVAVAQVNNEFGPQRDAILFEPGTYGSADNPLIFQVGYYTSVAGLGQSPGDVVINGSIYVLNQCNPGGCFALTNFWRSLSNLTLNVIHPDANHVYSPAVPAPESGRCVRTNDFWAVSQAAPIRRVAVNGFFSLFDYCGPKDFSSGGFIADSKLDGVLNGSQQQWITRSSRIQFWTNAVWNQVFSGVIGAPPQRFGSVAQQAGGPPPYTTLATSPVTREAPYLYLDATGSYNVFVPAVRHDSTGTTWEGGATPGTSIPIGKFFIAQQGDSVATINGALHRGQNLILSPGVYHLGQAIDVTRPDTIVIGLGFPTLIPTNGNASMTVASAKGILLSGLIFDAGATSSPVLLQVGDGHERSDNDASDPSALQDVFFRIGGAAAGKADASLIVNSNNVILDDIWSWRADHGNGVGWTSNTADTGVIVNGDNVTAYGLFVEHYQKYNVIWNGKDGRVVMFQNELPYDPPTQGAWSHDGIKGWAAIKVNDSAIGFEGWGLGSYCFFNVNPTLHATHSFEVPTSGIKLHDLLTVSLGGVGVIDHVVNDVGAAAQGVATIPVNLVSYP